ncbi:hypothetical protein [Aeribacillus alveayuensis]|uniref:Uncharacterized protein YozE (UPF0346 family) n=1 Tax=Aeribacillus alveayuensis TaxID=279215 RepID=A0ABT9VLT0_9BACI|nr:uncharacterized protein YozE (UPF0346 family) [Bacillus alveayuensis]
MHTIIDELNEITKKLYRVETREAMKKWKNNFERISTYIEKIEKYEGNIIQNDILEALQIITLAMQNKDYILMADLIRYELIPLLNK